MNDFFQNIYVWNYIISFLDVPDIYNLFLTNKTFNKILDKNILFIKFKNYSFKNYLPDEFSYMCDHFYKPNIKSKDFIYYESIRRNFIKSMIFAIDELPINLLPNFIKQDWLNLQLDQKKEIVITNKDAIYSCLMELYDIGNSGFNKNIIKEFENHNIKICITDSDSEYSRIHPYYKFSKIINLNLDKNYYKIKNIADTFHGIILPIYFFNKVLKISFKINDKIIKYFKTNEINDLINSRKIITPQEPTIHIKNNTNVSFLIALKDNNFINIFKIILVYGNHTYFNDYL